LLQHKVSQTVTEIEKLSGPTADFDSSLGQRVGFWMYSGEVIKDNFFLGVGTGDSMSEVFARVLPKDEGVKSIAHEHNQYISTLLQFGFIGLLIFLNVFYQIYKYRPKDKNLRFIQLAITLAIGVGITMTIFNLRVFIQLWILMLAVSMVDREHRTIQGAIQENRAFLVQTITLGLVFYTMVFLMKVF
jgi:O-antigen ligase